MVVIKLSNYFKYTLDCGLPFIYIYKPEFHKCYAGIGVKYGSSDVDFELDGIKYHSPDGLAHFIEHKLFLMPKGDTFAEFAKLNAIANAYTTCDRTIYFFTTTSDLEKPLKLLLDMYFTPYFPKEAVESEKSIINSEIRMYDDILETKFNQAILEALYPKHPLSKQVAGTIESVNKTSKEDIEGAYKAFYTCENSRLVIVGNKDPKIILKMVKEILKPLKLLNHQSKKLMTNDYAKPTPKINMELNVPQNLVTLAIRFNASNKIPLFCNYIIGIFDCLLSPVSRFYQELYKNGAFKADIEYYVNTLDATSYAIISTTSDKPKLFLEMLRTKLMNIEVADLDNDILENYIKHLRARAISELDTIEALGDNVLDLALEDIDYFNEQELMSKLAPKDFKRYLKYFKTAHYVEAICKKVQK